MPTCPKCGQENTEVARFCLACGAELTAATEATEERKIITVLFADLVGFTSRAEQLDPEDVRAMLSPYYARLRTVLERHGGRVEEFIGDAVMALFGAPVAHEDDPSAPCARRSRSASGGTGGSRAKRLQVRRGQHGRGAVLRSTRVSAGERWPPATSSTLRRGSRRRHRSTASSSTDDVPCHGARDRVRTPAGRGEGQGHRPGPGGAIPALARRRSAPRPCVARRAGAELDPPARRFARHAPTSAPSSRSWRPRDRQEPARLRALVASSTRTGAHQRGARAARSPTATASPSGHSAEMKAQAGILETDNAGAAPRRSSDAPCPRDPRRAGRAGRGQLRPLVGLAEADSWRASRPRHSRAWQRFFEALAEQNARSCSSSRTCSGPTTASSTSSTTWSSGRATRPLVVATARPSCSSGGRDWVSASGSATHPARDLRSPKTTQPLIVAALLEQAVLQAETQATLARARGGDPLYAEEYIRMLQDRGFLQREDDAWRFEGSDDFPLPETVQGIVAARLDSLSPAEKALVQGRRGSREGFLGWRRGRRGGVRTGRGRGALARTRPQGVYPAGASLLGRRGGSSTSSSTYSSATSHMDKFHVPGELQSTGLRPGGSHP